MTAPPEIDITTADQLRSVLLDTVFRVAQRERGGVISGERVRDSRNPARRCRAGFAVHGVGGVLILLI